MTIATARSQLTTWRTPVVILICACLIGIIGFGPRSALGLFLKPMSAAHEWGRDVFSLALAIQMLLWGVGQPFAGAVADRFGAVRVLCVGALFYALGLALMSYASTPLILYLTAGVMIGFGLSGCAFPLVVGALGKLMPEEWRSLSFGLGTAAGSFGQFLFSPISIGMMDHFAWQTTLLTFSVIVLMIMPLSLALASPKTAAPPQNAPRQQSATHALAEAFGHRSYVLLVIGFFTCGFQLFFITVHLPAYLADRGLSADIGGWTIAVIGLFNIVGSIASGWLAGFMPKRYLLSAIYFLRSLAVIAFILVPASPASSLIFGAVIGLLWLSTVPPTSGLVAIMFGTRWLAMLFGFAFFSHQVGGFLGVWLGGILYEQTGSYEIVWWLSVFFGVASALINLPIVEKPVVRAAVVPA
jgi:MFS family permease